MPANASYFSDGNKGVNFIVPEDKTALGTVTIQVSALIVPLFVSIFKTLSDQIIFLTIVLKLTGTSFLYSERSVP